mmetsp:Transcript_11663/g.29891  ORF Transcript_11663/g.29891 Transcript_11663/m.29891 type:complete len:334 (-) Transcript_11663:641-1642(-)
MAGADGSGAPAPFEAYADPYLLGVTAAATIAYQAIFFVVTAVCRTDRITDLAGGTNFVLLAGLTLGLGARPPSVRQAVLTGMVAAWGLRLSGFLFLRILQWGQDRRFDAQRRSLPRLAVFWSLQALWVWTVSLPLTFANSPPALPAPLGALDYVGWVAWAVGASLEAVADQQKLAFKKAQENRGRWCDAGVWGWSRRECPNCLPRRCRQACHDVVSGGWRPSLCVHVCVDICQIPTIVGRSCYGGASTSPPCPPWLGQCTPQCWGRCSSRLCCSFCRASRCWKPARTAVTATIADTVTTRPPPARCSRCRRRAGRRCRDGSRPRCSSIPCTAS